MIAEKSKTVADIETVAPPQTPTYVDNRYIMADMGLFRTQSYAVMDKLAARGAEMLKIGRTKRINLKDYHRLKHTFSV